MSIQLFCTRGCTHRPNLERELKHIGVAYELIFVEDQPDLAVRLRIRHSPTLVMDDQVLCIGQPTEGHLKQLLTASTADPQS